MLISLTILIYCRKRYAETDKGYFAEAQTQIDAEKRQDIIDAAKKIIHDGNDYLIDIPQDSLRSVTDSDIECIRSVRDFITDTQIPVSTYFENDIDVLITHLTKAIGEEGMNFNRKDLETLRQISRFLEQNSDTLQIPGAVATLHLIEYKIATRIL